MENVSTAAELSPVNAEGFNIFAELASWAAQLETWQQCALSKLVGQSTLTEADLNKIFEEFLWDRGLSPTPETRKTYDFQAPQSTPQTAEPIRLKAVNTVVGVNALLPNQHLDISPQLTVIYGPNGSGKSGYARILKASCFTRSKNLAILGNINLVQSDRPPISATFEMSDGTTEYLIPGKQNKVLRDNFAVFDSSCIRVHTDDKKAFVVTPFLFDVFPRMAEVVAQINERLKALKKTKEVNLSMFHLPDGKSEAAKLLNTLSAKTNRARLIELGTVTEQDTHRISQLGTEIEQLKKTDPAELIKKKQSALLDLDTLGAKVKAAIDRRNRHY
jgi:ABC-type cobalamin/Fe3+-siderophores transport system ATPase subunit